MTSPSRFVRCFPLVLAALLAGAEAQGQTPFAEADIFFELNDTDGDLGLHAKIDGSPWRTLTLASPDGQEKLRVSASGTLRRQGLTELFFESAERPFDELTPAAFFNRFQEGQWRISGIKPNGGRLESTDRLRKVMPAPAGNITISGVPAVENCDVVPLPVVSEPIVIAWDPVTTSHPEIGNPGAIEVVLYQLVVEQDELEFSVFLPPGVTEFELPEAFTGLSDEFKFEILVREETGNQTAIESCFQIE